MKMSSTTIFDFYVGIVCTFKSSQIAASGGRRDARDKTSGRDGIRYLVSVVRAQLY